MQLRNQANLRPAGLTLRPARATAVFRQANVQKTLARGQKRAAIPQAVAKPASAFTTSPSSEAATKNPLNIVFVAAEVAPWSKTGGLADVTGSLPVELA